MNTLSKTLTANFFATQDDYNALKKHWSKLVNSERKHELKPEHHLLYLALRGKDWRKAFSPITSRVKLDNGMTPNMARTNALSTIDWNYPRNVEKLLAPFDGLVTPQMLDTLRLLLPKPYDVKEAYNVPESTSVAA